MSPPFMRPFGGERRKGSQHFPSSLSCFRRRQSHQDFFSVRSSFVFLLFKSCQVIPFYAAFSLSWRYCYSCDLLLHVLFPQVVTFPFLSLTHFLTSSIIKRLSADFYSGFQVCNAYVRLVAEQFTMAGEKRSPLPTRSAPIIELYLARLR